MFRRIQHVSTCIRPLSSISPLCINIYQSVCIEYNLYYLVCIKSYLLTQSVFFRIQLVLACMYQIIFIDVIYIFSNTTCILPLSSISPLYFWNLARLAPLSLSQSHSPLFYVSSYIHYILLNTTYINLHSSFFLKSRSPLSSIFQFCFPISSIKLWLWIVNTQTVAIHL